jgi:hypothetical protein
MRPQDPELDVRRQRRCHSCLYLGVTGILVHSLLDFNLEFLPTPLSITCWHARSSPPLLQLSQRKPVSTEEHRPPASEVV